MPRKQNQVPAPIEVAVNAEAIAEGQEARNQLAVLHEQDAANVKVLATQLGYTGRLDSDSLESVCKAKLVAAQQSIFEFGASLLLLRESCLHGDWEERLGRIGGSRPTAHRYITIAAKLKGTDVQKALQHLGMGKVLELAAFDDDEIQALTGGESIRGLTLDQVEKMSLADLRKQLREATANSEAKERLIADKDAKINSLIVGTGKKIVADTDWPDALIPLCDQLAACKREIDHAFSKLETARIAVLQVEMPEDQRPKFEAALKHVAEVYASALASAERNYLKDQVVFAQTLGAYLEMDEV